MSSLYFFAQTLININYMDAKNTVKGFTLIELMITIAILGILYAIALPAYNNYLQDSRRADIQRLMMQEVASLERQYTRLGGYPDNYTPTINDFYVYSYAPSTSAAVTLVLLNDSTTFLLTASPKSGTAQAGDRCADLSIDHEGTKTSTGMCW